MASGMGPDGGHTKATDLGRFWEEQAERQLITEGWQ